MSEHGDEIKREFMDVHIDQPYFGFVKRYASSNLIRINDGEDTCVLTENGFVEMLRVAREVLSTDKARAIALYYKRFLEEES